MADYRLLKLLPRLIPLLIGLISLGAAAPLLAAPAADPAAIPGTRWVPQSALGQPAGLTMRVRAAYEGHYKVGEWFPVQVDLSNDGTGTVAGQLQVVAKNDNGDNITTYVRDVELPPPSRKQVTLNTYAATYARSFDVRLVSGSTTLIKQTVAVDPVEYPAFLLGVVSADSGLLNVLNGESVGTLGSTPPGPGPILSSAPSSHVTVAHLQPGDLPGSAAALAGLDALVLAGTDTSNLAAEVHTALEGWVLRGGTLVVAGSGSTPVGLSDLLPVQLSGTRQATDFSALSAYSGISGTLQSAGPVLVAAAVPLPERGARVLASDGAGPLLVERRYGAGTILFLALDPAQPPLAGWNGTAALWQRALSTTSVELSMVAQRRLQNQFGYIYYGYNGNPFNIPGLNLPNAWLVGGFLLVYVLLIGPVNYLVLRALKRVELAWVTIPALIVLFVAGAYLLGVGTKGTDARLSEASVVRVYDGAALATVDSFVGIVSPVRQTFDLVFAGDVPLTELDPSSQGLARGVPAAIQQGRPTRVQGLPLDTWTLRGFLAESTVAYTDPFTAQLRLDNGRITGQLVNRGTTVLRDVGVVHGDAAVRVGDLPPGGSATVNLSLSNPYGPDTLAQTLLPGYNTAAGPDRAVVLRRAGLLTSVFPPNTAGGSAALRVTVVGWSDTPPLDPQVPGHKTVRDPVTLVVGELPVAVPSGAQTLPRYLVGWQVVAGDTNPGYGAGLLNFRLDSTPTVFQFVLPPGFQAATLAVNCEVSTYSGYFNIQPAFYNWTTNQYDPVLQNGQPQMITSTANGSYVSALLGVPAPVAAYIGPRGEVNLRLSSQSGATDMQLQDLSISGTSR
jgi:hypothetical protein